MSDETHRNGEPQPASPSESPQATVHGSEAPEPPHDEGSGGGPQTSPAGAQAPGSGGGLRLVAAAVTLPWLFLYGATGVWALGLAARSAGQGLKRVDAGYTRFVTPPQLAFVGALLLTAFAVLLVCGLLLLFGKRSVVVWLPVLLVAAGLTAGALWAGISGGIHPLMWVFLFFGLVYVTAAALLRVLQVTRAKRRATIGRS